MNESYPLPPRLRDLEIAAVRPLAAPWKRTLALAPVGVLVLALTPLMLGVRVDADRLGWVLGWGASVVQLLIGLWCVGLALRESVPGRAASSLVIGVTVVIAVGAVVLIALATNSVSAIAPFRGWLIGAICFVGLLVLSLPVLVGGAVLCARAFPLRPWLAGLLYGLGAGLISDSGWRLFCHFSALDHLLIFHIVPTLLAGVVGVFLARYFQGGFGK